MGVLRSEGHSAGVSASERGREIRLLSYNIRSLRDDPAAVARVILDVAADVVCIQEAPRFLRWRAKCARLARESGLYVVTGGRTAAGVLLLAALRVGVRWTRDIRLSHQPGLHHRGVALAGLEIAGRRFVVGSIHLGLDAAERVRHVDEILAIPEIAQPDGPVILAGDINEEPSGVAWQRLAARFTDAYAAAGVGSGETYSARTPRSRIDAIFLGEGLTAVECGVPEHPAIPRASDHRPVAAVLTLRDQTTAPSSGSSGGSARIR
ncbi:MAG: endonuclease/exonuclease/phosphatase family protein [Acidothermus sp.]|nr:endonuclease/exonuclease/phosphatase family protein [Acidothermus sp.]MCL6537628.1 endonuclease/exonuclease/phosphatase family protein [Acidothermus sp.]